jgi:hypothetical protein
MTFLLALVVLPAASDSGGSAIVPILGSLCGAFLGLLLAVAVIAGMYGVFVKAGKPGWAAIIPYYNVFVLVDIVGKPWWWALLILFCPCVGIVFAVLVYIELANCFGKSVGFAVGLLLLPYVFFPILGFNKDRYTPPQREDAEEEEAPRRRRRRPNEYDEG